MNRENVTKVRDALQAYVKEGVKPQVPGDGKLGFLMREAFTQVQYKLPPDCGSAGCMIAWTNVICGEEQQDIRDYGDEIAATRHLGLTNSEREDLFYPVTEVGLCEIEAEDAISALNLLLDTGEIGWPEEVGYRPRESAKSAEDKQ